MLEVRRLTVDDSQALAQMLMVFAEVFDDQETYGNHHPDVTYQQQLLANDHFIGVVATIHGAIAGALAAYVLPKFEQKRSEVYIYDLAVRHQHRRQGVATQLIKCVQVEAKKYHAHVIFVQADTGPEDAAAISLYTKLGLREDVLHFDIPV